MTREETRNAVLIMEAYIDGYKIQRCGKQWNPRESLKPDWSDIDDPCWDFDSCYYRLKPTPVLRPWTADEVPIGAITRIKHSVNPSNPSRQIIDGENGVMAFLCGCPWSLEDLLRMREHSTDGGLNWKPCGVEEVGK